MYLAHIFLPAMLIIICRSQQAPSHLPGTYGSDESLNYFGIQPVRGDSFAPLVTESSTELLDRYRQLIAKSLLNLRDSCKVHDFLQNLKHNMEVDSDDEESSDKSVHSHQQRYINTLLQMLERQHGSEATLFLSPERSDNSKMALYYYISTSMLVQDKELDDTINAMLYEKCCKNDANFFGSSICSQNDNNNNNNNDGSADKRNTIKKVKFHSWGGKRSGDSVPSNVRIQTNADLIKDSGQSKIVIRTPFRPWGGKRSLLPESV